MRLHIRGCITIMGCGVPGSLPGTCSLLRAGHPRSVYGGAMPSLRSASLRARCPRSHKQCELLLFHLVSQVMSNVGCLYLSRAAWFDEAQDQARCLNILPTERRCSFDCCGRRLTCFGRAQFRKQRFGAGRLNLAFLHHTRRNDIHLGPLRSGS